MKTEVQGVVEKVEQKALSQHHDRQLLPRHVMDELAIVFSV